MEPGQPVVVCFVDDGHPESRDYDDNYVWVTLRAHAVRSVHAPAAQGWWSACCRWWRRLAGACRPVPA